MKISYLWIILIGVGVLSTGVSYALTQVGGGDDIQIPATKKLYLDGGTNTYIQDNTALGAGTIDFFSGGSEAFRVQSSGFTSLGDMFIPTTKKVYTDGGVNTYFTSPSVGITDYYVGGARMMSMNQGGGAVYVTGSNLSIDSGKKLYLDGGGDTYISETSANVLDIYAGGVKKIDISSDVCIGSC